MRRSADHLPPIRVPLGRSLLFVVLAALGAHPAEARSARPLAPEWKPASSLASEEDRRLAARHLARLCPGSQCPGAAALEAALVPIGARGDVLLVRLPSGGTCGPFEMSVFAPASSDGRRRGRGVTPEPELFAACGEALTVRPDGTDTPDLLTTAFTERTSPRGPVLETTTWRWTGKTYRDVARRRERARTGG